MCMKISCSQVLNGTVVFDGIMQIYFTQQNGMESIKNNHDISCFYVPQKLVMFKKH
jgi:hypothetical protein